MALALPLLTIAAIAAAVAGAPYGTNEDFLFERYINAPLEDSTGPFAWKDEQAARDTHRSLEQYVIEGMEPSFRNHVADLLHALDDAGMRTCINSGYRGLERQLLIKAGKHAKPGTSYHGGGPNQAYGNGLAADLVTCFGVNQKERDAHNASIYAWVDAHGADFNIGRPYGDWDAGHVGPRDGKEYAEKRSGHGRLARTWRHRFKTRIAHDRSGKRRVASIS